MEVIDKKKKLDQINAVNTILCMAEQLILEQTGLKMTVIVTSKYRKNMRTPEGLLNVIAGAMDMHYTDYQEHTRKPEYVLLRGLGAYFTKLYYPNLSLMQVGKLTGIRDHSTVLHNIRRVEKQIRERDAYFLEEYEVVLDAVTQWIKE